jgi:transposase-like protein
MKYSAKIRDIIVELVSTGDHTIEAICSHVGIVKDTYYRWRETKTDFSDALKRAEKIRLESLGTLAQSGLAILLTKHEYEEVTTEYIDSKDGKPKIKSQKKVRKFIMPNPTAVIFALTNRKPDDWKQKQSVEHSGSIMTTPINVSIVPPDEE